jgi:undecaprenyl diphosphate synthase
MQSNLSCQSRPPVPHVAIIMDGNGRWATRRGLPRTAGHRAGVAAVRRTVEWAAVRGVGTLTLFAFSGDNWRRPDEEVDGLMWLFRVYVRSAVARFVAEGLRLSVIGRRDRLPAALRREIQHAEAATAHGAGLHVRIAVDYSARHAIAGAAALVGSGSPPSVELFARTLGEAPDVDLLIRTGGEKRLSDFMLWEAAYAELVFTDVMWPDMGEGELDAALDDFRRRDRRFGGLGGAAAPLREAAE